MDDEIQQYIYNQLNRAPALFDSLSRDAKGVPYAKRYMFVLIEKMIKDFIFGKRELRIIGIPGLRGVGKTTLLAQSFKILSPEYSRQFLFVSADEIVNLLRSNLMAALNMYQKIIGTSFEKLTKPHFIFIDEIHFDKNWANVLKSIYDRTKNVFIICTGSSALSLRASSDLARRITFEHLYPFKFIEYINLKSYMNSKKIFPEKGFSQKIKEAIFYSADANKCFQQLESIQLQANQYWQQIDILEIDQYLKFKTMPFMLNVNDEEHCFSLTNGIIDRVIEKDLMEYGKFSSNTLSKAKSILLMIASSDEISLINLTKNLRDISVNTLIDFFAALEKAEMLIRIYPYGSAYKKVRKPSKYLFTSPALRYSLLSVLEGNQAFLNHKGKYLEDVATLSILRSFKGEMPFPLCYDSAKNGADFIIQMSNKKIVIELGYGKKGETGIIQIRNTMERYQGTYGILISDSELEFFEEEKVIGLPLKFFLLL